MPPAPRSSFKAASNLVLTLRWLPDRSVVKPKEPRTCNFRAEILSYSRSRGLFAGESLEGAVLKQDDDANEHLYGRAVDPKEILFTRKVAVPAAARPLDAALAKYSPNGGKPFPSA